MRCQSVLRTMAREAVFSVDYYDAPMGIGTYEVTDALGSEHFLSLCNFALYKDPRCNAPLQTTATATINYAIPKLLHLQITSLQDLWRRLVFSLDPAFNCHTCLKSRVTTASECSEPNTVAAT